jgi:hypothetical protein
VDLTAVFSNPRLVPISSAVNNIALYSELHDTLRYLGLTVCFPDSKSVLVAFCTAINRACVYLTSEVMVLGHNKAKCICTRE